MSSPKWQKSSYSEAASSCLYLAAGTTGAIHLRESDTPDTVLTTTPGRLRPLISALKAGSLDRALVH
ncbi:DUF397 domain-containing protein [Streptomyces sp. SCA3-4]|uniref:DUF397 domain-containing protein n=1 Tax=Streptomyces sichuanensis TaxID=2871810 RepID=UPI001CE282CA|nr:DUF397 domain-containing protein [Streptomyces sichuanensis]MCA6091495.1 DUF397 domain-containing protein [Streptomyces sichuanensis]